MEYSTSFFGNQIDSASLDINEEKIMSAANAFVSLGLKDAGYQYISIDVSGSNHPAFATS